MYLPEPAWNLIKSYLNCNKPILPIFPSVSAYCMYMSDNINLCNKFNRSLNESEERHYFITEMMQHIDKPCNCCNECLEKYWIDCWETSLSEYQPDDLGNSANTAARILEEKKFGFNRKNYLAIVTELYNYHKKYDDDLTYQDMERMFVESLVLGVVCEY